MTTIPDQSEDQLLLSTEPLRPLPSRYAEARNRVIATFGPRVGDSVAAADFDRCLSALGRLGLHASGLLVAAEHMTTTRLRLHNDNYELESDD